MKLKVLATAIVLLSTSFAPLSASEIYTNSWEARIFKASNWVSGQITDIKVLPAGDQGYSDSIYCVKDETATYICWGNNAYILNTLNPNYDPAEDKYDNGFLFPKYVQKFPNLKQLEIGSKMACGLRLDGLVECWGEGFLGDEVISSTRGTADGKVVLNLYGKVKQISKSNRHLCLLNKSGQVFCWGSNNSGELGIAKTVWGTFINIESALVPSPVLKIRKITGISLTQSRTCAVAKKGEVYCWGFVGSWTGRKPTNEYKKSWAGQPLLVKQIKNPKSLALSGSSTCVLNQLGQVHCLGKIPSSLDAKQHITTTKLVPIKFAGNNLESVSQLVAGSNHFCAIKIDKRVVCWGDNYSEQLGTHTKGEYLSFQSANEVLRKTYEYFEFNQTEKIFRLENIRLISANNDYTCVVDESNEIYCWGGVLGQGGLVDSIYHSY